MATRKPRPAVPCELYLFRAVAGFPAGAEPGRDPPRAGGAVAILHGGGAGEGRRAVGRDHRHVRAVEHLGRAFRHRERAARDF